MKNNTRKYLASTDEVKDISLLKFNKRCVFIFIIRIIAVLIAATLLSEYLLHFLGFVSVLSYIVIAVVIFAEIYDAYDTSITVKKKITSYLFSIFSWLFSVGLPAAIFLGNMFL